MDRLELTRTKLPESTPPFAPDFSESMSFRNGNEDPLSTATLPKVVQDEIAQAASAHGKTVPERNSTTNSSTQGASAVETSMQERVSTISTATPYESYPAQTQYYPNDQQYYAPTSQPSYENSAAYNGSTYQNQLENQYAYPQNGGNYTDVNYNYYSQPAYTQPGYYQPGYYQGGVPIQTGYYQNPYSNWNPYSCGYGYGYGAGYVHPYTFYGRHAAGEYLTGSIVTAAAVTAPLAVGLLSKLFHHRRHYAPVY